MIQLLRLRTFQGCSSTIAIAWISSFLDWWIMLIYWSTPTEISRTLGGLFHFAPSDLKGQSADFRLIFGWLSFLRLLYQFSFPPNNLFDTLEREDVHDGFECPQGQRGWLNTAKIARSRRGVAQPSHGPKSIAIVETPAATAIGH